MNMLKALKGYKTTPPTSVETKGKYGPKNGKIMELKFGVRTDCS
jgi:hypothetical protein